MIQGQKLEYNNGMNFNKWINLGKGGKSEYGIYIGLVKNRLMAVFVHSEYIFMDNKAERQPIIWWGLK